jgi:signal transduction histidine kinase
MAGHPARRNAVDTADPIARLRHDIANPLAALLAEVQLLLLDAERLDPETVRGLREVERLAGRIRTILRETRAG